MFRRFGRFVPSPAMGVALLALSVGLGGSGVAAALGNFILGTVNSANRVTQLDSNALTTTLKLTNSGTGVKSTPLTLVAGEGRPALQVSNTTKIVNLNADLLDGWNSLDFSRAKVTGFLQDTLSGQITSVPGDETYILSTKVITPFVDSTCQVTSTTQIEDVDGEGPYYRNAVQAGDNDLREDRYYGLYFIAHGPSDRPALSRTSFLTIPAKTPARFGVYLGSAPTGYTTKSLNTALSVICFATGGLPDPATNPASARTAPSKTPNQG